MHKSQGATEPHGVMATLDKNATNKPGLAYVALSRVTTWQSLFEHVEDDKKTAGMRHSWLVAAVMDGTVDQTGDNATA
eukprot:2126931-Heterocapsa_arctica.AAC.1